MKVEVSFPSDGCGMCRMMQATLLFLLMKYLYIDESFDEKTFVVGGIISNKNEEISKTFKKLKKQIRSMSLPNARKRKIMYEFKSFILDNSFPKIKKRLLKLIEISDLEIIYSYKCLDKIIYQKQKELIYLILLKNIINHINDDIVVITFDSFNNIRFNSKIEKEIKELRNVKEVLCMNSYDSKGLQFADNVVGTIRRHLSGIDINNDYEIISNKVIGV